MTTIRQAIALLPRHRRRRFGLVALLSVVVSGLEAVSAVLVLVLLRLVLEPGRIPDVPIIGDPRRILPVDGYREIVLGFSVIFIVFFLVRAVAFLFQQYALIRVAEGAGVDLAHRLVDGYLSMPYQFHVRRNSSELIRNAYANSQELVGSVYSPVTTVFAESVLVVVMLAVLLIASPVATAAAALLMGLTIWLTFAVVQPRLKRLGKQRQDASRAAIKHLQQGFAGVRDIKILARERAFSQSFRRARVEMSHAHQWRVVLSYVPRVTIETMFLLFVLAILTIAVLSSSVETVLATLGLFAYAGMRLQPSLQKIANGLNNVRYAEAAVQELADDAQLLDESLSDRDRQDTRTGPLPFVDRIALEHVSFVYDGAGDPALRDVDLTIHAGEAIGIAGETGGGKSTLLDVLCGLLPPTEGCLTVDGVDVADRTRAWQQAIGVVHQSSFLIDDTVRRNVAFGQPDAAIDDDRVWRALEVAALADHVGGLPDGLDAVVGEAGVRLSGGQRQRITLARAFYRQPRLLVLDEGTAALDNATEAQIIANLERLRGDMTLVVVAHRLTTIRRCDRLIVLEAGRITGMGTYEDLKRTNAGFRAIAV